MCVCVCVCGGGGGGGGVSEETSEKHVSESLFNLTLFPCVHPLCLRCFSKNSQIKPVTSSKSILYRCRIKEEPLIKEMFRSLQKSPFNLTLLTVCIHVVSDVSHQIPEE